MESRIMTRMVSHAVGVARRSEETSCGWRLWISTVSTEEGRKKNNIWKGK